MGLLQWVLIQSDRCPYKKKKFGHAKIHRGAIHIEERPEEDAARRQPPTSQSARSRNPADTSSLDFQPPELWENRSLLFKSPQSVVSVVAACTDYLNNHCQFVEGAPLPTPSLAYSRIRNARPTMAGTLWSVSRVAASGHWSRLWPLLPSSLPVFSLSFLELLIYLVPMLPPSPPFHSLPRLPGMQN